MRVPVSWLSEFVDWPWEVSELAERLTMAGLPVDAVSAFGEGLSGVVAARVIDIGPHPSPAPEGHPYWVATVEAGPGRCAQVVAGVANVRPGDIVAYAPPGSVLPGGWRIGPVNVRGVLSEGMLLALSELVLGEKPREGEGILVLPPDLAPGTDVAAALGLPELVLELDLTPNYAAHCQSILGVAREVAALAGFGPSGLSVPDPYARLRPAGEHASALAAVAIHAPDHCPRYVARVIRGVALGPSPWRVQLRLLACGMRPINNVVDATNYVMLECGQPLHAFDLARLEERRIVVRLAAAGERVVTLDGVERSLEPDMLVIADARRPVAVAGVMGGLDTEVTPATRDILLESASFNALSVRRTASRLGLVSEASSRFDKGADPEMVDWASARAAALIAESAGGRVAPGSVDVDARPFVRRELGLRSARVGRLLGAPLDRETVRSYLALLGFGVRPAPWVAGADAEAGSGRNEAGGLAGSEPDLLVTVPSWRGDVTEEVDLVEEVARLYGYDRIEPTLPTGPATVGRRPAREVAAERVRRALVARGFTELVSFSLVDPEVDRLLGPAGSRPLALANPLSSKQSALRTSVLVSLLEAVARNLSYAERSLRLFEVGTVYLEKGAGVAGGELPEERRRLALVAVGPGPEASWRRRGEEPDFPYVKGLVELVLRELGVAGWRLERSADPRWHPHRQAVLLLDRTGGPGRRVGSAGDPVSGAGGPAANPVEVGKLGEVHPRLLAKLDIGERVLAAELDLDALADAERVTVHASELPRFPAVVRDVAVILPERVEVARIQEVIRRAAGALCVGTELFDVYHGHPVPAGCRSTAWRVVYRSPDRSLTDAEVDEVHGRVRGALEGELGAVLR
ncbi:MAG: phenylalanine--tRNA ligase subunit beta [Firmicutes bacterium]|nr:phenylalanine--tRNA ligase subunit beta [Bacillota bacterium]